ncbi:MAG TPA: hypothetical protein PK291_02590 [Thermotogota bacterium]|nr:hypothetical protein [Thermotogota bacterium]
MVSATKEIIEKEMTISDIEKRFHVSTQRAVQLFCQAEGVQSKHQSIGRLEQTDHPTGSRESQTVGPEPRRNLRLRLL